MNVGIVTTHVPPVLGGIEVHCVNLAKALGERGHSVTLFGSLEEGQGSTLREESWSARVKVIRVPALFSPGLKRPTRAFNLAFKLIEQHRSKPFDVLHAHQLYPVATVVAEVARVLRVRLVITEHGSVLDDSKSPFRRVLTRRACRQAASVLTASEELASVVRDVGVREDLVVSLPNAIPIKEFEAKGSSQKSRLDLGVDEGDFVAMTVRRLVPKTGVQYAIRALPLALQRIPELKLVVLGDGPMRSNLEALAQSLGVWDRVVFLGAIANQEVVAYMKTADVGLFPSLAEATSIAALEFMAAGVPVAASSVGGLPEIIEDGVTGFLFDFGFSRSRYDDPGLPQEAVANLATSLVRAACADLSTMGRFAAARVRERHSWESYCEILESKHYRAER